MAERQLWERVVAGHFVLPKRSYWPNFFSRRVARLQWNPAAIDLEPDARAWPELPAERRDRSTISGDHGKPIARISAASSAPAKTRSTYCGAWASVSCPADAGSG